MQPDLNLAAAGRRFRRDPWLLAGKQDEQATLGPGMLDRDPQQRLDELAEFDLARHRLRGLEHCSDIQLFGGRANGNGGRCGDWCVAEMRMKLFELPHLSSGSPTEVAVASGPQAQLSEALQPSGRVAAGGELIRERLVMDETVCLCRTDGPFVEALGIELAPLQTGDLRPDQRGAILEILRAIRRPYFKLPVVSRQSLEVLLFPIGRRGIPRCRVRKRRIEAKLCDFEM